MRTQDLNPTLAADPATLSAAALDTPAVEIDWTTAHNEYGEPAARFFDVDTFTLDLSADVEGIRDILDPEDFDTPDEYETRRAYAWGLPEAVDVELAHSGYSVEDDDANRDAIRDALTDAGYDEDDADRIADAFDFGDIEPEDFPEPMMSYHYPLPYVGQSAAALALALAGLPLLLVYWDDADTYSLALTGGGMDLSWEICEAFVRLGFLPPVRFADLPGMAGRGLSERDGAILAACIEAADEHERAAARTAAYIREKAARIPTHERERIERNRAAAAQA